MMRIKNKYDFQQGLSLGFVPLVVEWQYLEKKSFWDILCNCSNLHYRHYSSWTRKCPQPQGKIVLLCLKYREGHDVGQSVAVAEIDLDLIKKIWCEMPGLGTTSTGCKLAMMQKSRLTTARTSCSRIKWFPGPLEYRVLQDETQLHSFAYTNIRCVVPYRILRPSNLTICWFLEYRECFGF
jgi:hypothetical protein